MGLHMSHRDVSPKQIIYFCKGKKHISSYNQITNVNFLRLPVVLFHQSKACDLFNQCFVDGRFTICYLSSGVLPIQLPIAGLFLPPGSLRQDFRLRTPPLSPPRWPRPPGPPRARCGPATLPAPRGPSPPGTRASGYPWFDDGEWVWRWEGSLSTSQWLGAYF